MSIVDIILIAILLFAAWKGFSRGLVIEIASLVALLLGIYAAINFSGLAAELIDDYISVEPRLLRILSFAVTFVLVMLAVILVGRIMEKLVNLVMLGFLNKILGSVFSIFKAAVILSVLLMLINLLDPKHRLVPDEHRDASVVYSKVEKIVPTLLEVMRIEGNPLEVNKDIIDEIQI